MKLQFLGCGDALGSGGRFNTCFYVQHPAGGFLIDCGATSLVAIRKFGVDPNTISLILISHLHGDHFAGLPFLIPALSASGRRTPLTIAGPPGLRDRLLATMENFFPGSSTADRPFEWSVRELEPELKQEVEGVAVTPYLVKHPCGAPPFALRIKVDGKILCYSGDTEWVDNLICAAKGADLFIAEAYSPAKSPKPHLDFATLSAHLPEIGARRVILTHMHTSMLAEASTTGCELAEDGKIISI
ncbi:MAG TPA: MBL fold metallo-hydrolase [Candidatus Angelobacter sp.]|jgi:ribonuclease BN (tRNA processing enzyme)|nr:MBL fold metallo-hydrolase [Candidatus Angelobacter sp.]